MNPLAGYPVTQTWEQHIARAGAALGGEDYEMPVGTPLPILPGELEWVTPATARPPAWYNTGLGNAAAYRRSDGTRTVYGHCSRLRDGVVLSGDTGKSTGPHVHVHDVLADGVTRDRPFTTIKSGAPMFIVHHVVGTNQAKYLFTGLVLRPATASEIATLATVRADGEGGLQPYLTTIAAALKAIAAASTPGGVFPTVAAIADAVADEQAERLKE